MGRRFAYSPVVICGQVPIGYNYALSRAFSSIVVICGQVPIGYNQSGNFSFPVTVVICGQVPIGYNPAIRTTPPDLL